MAQRTKTEILASMAKAIQDASPQVRIDADKGPFFYLASQAVSGPLADASKATERVALLSTNQFPSVATSSEAMAVARAFGIGVGGGGFSRGIAYVFTGRRPTGSESFTVEEGATFSTSTNRGVVFEAIESRSLTAANADAYFNPTTRRFELPVTVRALSAGVSGNIPARTLTTILGGATSFEGVVNLIAFFGGSESQSVEAIYRRAQQRLAGLDNFSRGGLKSRVLEVDVNRIEAVELTYSSEYPSLFYRLPDDQAIDIWVVNTPREVMATETFTGAAGQTSFTLSNAPAVSLASVFVNDSPVTATLVLDENLETGRSVREASYVSLAAAVSAGDVVDVIYTYDACLGDIKTALDGLYNTQAGSLFATDLLVRYARTIDVAVTVMGTALGTFDTTTIEEEVASVIGSYVANGTGTAPLVGGVRSPAELRDLIRSIVPGIGNLAIPVFGRKSLGTIVETIDIPRNATIRIANPEDIVTSFT